MDSLQSRCQRPRRALGGSTHDVKRVLFICTHNSARSQMAEALLNTYYGGRYLAFSAGTSPREVDPHAVRVMAEIGIDISKHRSKSLTEFLGSEFDYVVTVCDQAREACPFFPAKKIIHKGFEDPARLKGTEDQVLARFRLIRDQIREWIDETFGGPSPPSHGGKRAMCSTRK